MIAQNKSNEIKITRIYDAPLEAVWDAWTDPEQVAQWWGPRGFTLTTHSKDLRPGGTWRYTMHGPDGTDYPNTTRISRSSPVQNSSTITAATKIGLPCSASRSSSRKPAARPGWT